MIDRFGVIRNPSKKDAKELAKSMRIPLHEALDIVAIENAELNWNRAVYRIENATEVEFFSSCLASFVLSMQKGSDSNYVHCSLEKQAQIALISGQSGSGKSVAALCLAEQHCQFQQPN